MVTQVPSFSLNALPFSKNSSTSGSKTVLEPQPSYPPLGTKKEEGAGRERLTSSFKDISQESHDTLLFTIHWTALSHLAHSGSKKLKNVDLIPDNCKPSHTSGILLLKKKDRRYIERILAVFATGGNMNSIGVLIQGRKGN